jgi:hypothetical protein
MNAPVRITFRPVRSPGATALLRLATLAQSLTEQREALALLCIGPDLRARKAYRGEIVEDQVCDALRVLPGFKVRERRYAESTEGFDYLTVRRPGNVRTRVLHQAARELARTFHGAQHGHQITTRIVEPGDERAESTESTTISLGPVAVFSRHVFCVSTVLFSIPRSERRDAQGRVYLSPTVRVKQGRGTSLVTERKVGKHWEAA